MTINFEDESGIDLHIPLETIAEKVINAALDEVGCPYEAEISLTVTDNEHIHEMNKQFRGVDRPTDVLSFPMQNFPSPADFSFLEDESEESDFFDPETGELQLGDIVISADKVIEQAEEYGHSVTREFAFLVTHSVLHLTGFDHMTEEEAAQMEARQRKILDGLGITR